MELVNPIFLLGTQRSGTTLLARILSSHSKLYIQNELPMDGLFDTPMSKEIIIDRFKTKISRMHRVEVSRYQHELPIWGLKDPLLTYQLDALEQYFPESKYILIVRDGRGVVNSYIENRWGLGTNVFTGAQRWLREVSIQRKFCEQMQQNSITLRFEDLVADIQTQTRRVCDFLGVEFEEGMLVYHQKESGFGRNRENLNTDRAPDQTISEKWKQKLTMRQVSIIESLSGEELSLYGYERIGNRNIKVGFLERLYYKVHQLVIGEIQLQYQLKVRDFLKKVKSVLGWSSIKG